VDDGFTLRISSSPSIWFPRSALSALKYHLEENGESIDELATLIELTTRHQKFFDIGAAEGLFSAVFCALSSSGRVSAYEPSPTMVPRLRELVERNRFQERLQVNEKALGRATGARLAGFSSNGFLDSAAADATTVAFTTLDEECARTFVPDLVKIDVEGFELEVLEGGHVLFSRHRPVLMLEVHADLIAANGGNLSQIAKLLDGWGYRASGVDGRPLSTRQLSQHPAAVFRVVATPR
jgi:FkbM family methyltransferase